MKKENKNNRDKFDDDLLENYDFDYSKAKPNRFAPILAEQEGYVKLQDDVRKIFINSEQVNNVLRAIISAFPKTKKSLAKTT